MLTQRQNQILKIIIEDYVKTAEPVGSKSICDRLGVSSATIRNEMSFLESEGYLDKTHSSSGRVPVDKAYRYYVEFLLKEENDSDFENQVYDLVDNIFQNKIIKREDAISKACSLISQITNYTTVALEPSESDKKVARIELVQLKEYDFLMVVITESGHIESRNVSFHEDEIEPEELKKIVETLNDVLKGTKLSEVSKKLAYIKENHLIEEFLNYRDSIINNFIDAFMKFAESNYYVSGSSNMLVQPEFQDANRLRKLIDILEKKDLIKVLKDTPTDRLSIMIGKETGMDVLDKATIISVPFEDEHGEMGNIAIVGPTRMDYKRVIPLMEYIAKDISKLNKKKRG